MAKYIARRGSTKDKYRFSLAIEEVYFEKIPMPIIISVSLVKGKHWWVTMHRKQKNREQAIVGAGPG